MGSGSAAWSMLSSSPLCLIGMSDTALVGAHVPTTGGVANAPANGTAIGATAIQIFTRNQRQWACKPLAAGEAAAFRAALRGSGVRAVLSHASYLINLASVVPDFLEKSRAALVEELRRCHHLGIPYAVVHPGAHMGAGETAGLDAVARSLDHVLRRTRGRTATPLLEVTAGQGTCLGHTLRAAGGDPGPREGARARGRLPRHVPPERQRLRHRHRPRAGSGRWSRSPAPSGCAS